MRTKTPVWLFLLFTLALPASVLAKAEISPIESLGDNTYSVTARASSKFTRNTTKLKAAAIKAATDFCAKEGKQFKLLSAEEDKAMYVIGESMSTTVVTFKALAAGAPELAAAPGETARPAAPATPTDALYDELTKLDELRKKGILNDEEFAAQKKKILDRSK